MEKTRKEKLKFVVLWIGYLTIGAYAASYCLTYASALFLGYEAPLISINAIGELIIELPVFILTLPCMVYSIWDIRVRMLRGRSELKQFGFLLDREGYNETA